MNRTLIVAVVSSILFLFLSLFLSAPLERIEDQLLDTRYELRGEVPADTNVVILYFDNDDIAALGGWPLRRNFYALLVDVLHQSGASAIGIDIFFGEQSLEFPEYDALLASKARESNNVVVSTYFRSLAEKPVAAAWSSLPDKFYLFDVNTGLSGANLQLPYTELIEAAAGIGHTNLINGSSRELPLFVREGNRALPAFSLELIRLHRHARREQLRVKDRTIEFISDPEMPHISFHDDGLVTLNFPGSLTSFRSYRSVEVLRSFELKRSGLAPPLDLSTLANKIVLIGVIGEGRGNFVKTPFTPSFPPIALHASAIDNALNSRFLTLPDDWSSGIVAMSLTLLAVLAILRLPQGRGLPVVLFMLVLYFALTQFLFVAMNFLLPVVKPLVVLLGTAAVTMFLEHRSIKNRMSVLESQKIDAETALRQREVRLQMLERELMNEPKAGSSRRSELVDEIRKYKQDIKKLSDQVADLVKYEPPAEVQFVGPLVFEGIVYDGSEKMKDVVAMIEKIAASDASVFILGESGTGKELVARAIHNRSNRGGTQFVAVNCGAITETLLESELFGHEKGAFTGAVKDKIGRFEVADGGTIFLDEIAETSEAFQVKLLRVIQEGEIERVGSSATRKINTRIIAATNKNIHELVRGKQFREDLYYRLNVFTIELPHLRDRRGDIPVLTEFFLRKEDSSVSISNTVLDAFLQYSWPGNVRELESAVKRAVILAKAEQRTLVQVKDIPDAISAAVLAQIDIEDQILDSLRAKKFTRNSISETASEMGGLNRGTVAEYFRGICFRYFFDNSWQRRITIEQIAATTETEVIRRVEKKVAEYLSNVVDGLKAGQHFEEVRQILKPKYKNLPQRYHSLLDEVVRAYLDKKWTL